MSALAPAGARPPASGDPWGPFADTVLRFGAAPHPLAIDLRAPVTSEQRATLATLGLAGSFAVVTAQDPFGVTAEPARNRALAEDLDRAVVALGAPIVPVQAGSSDFSHAERSLAIAIGHASAVSLARRYGQLALFWFDGDAFWIVPVVQRGPAVRLPRLPIALPAAAAAPAAQPGA